MALAKHLQFGATDIASPRASPPPRNLALRKPLHPRNWRSGIASPRNRHRGNRLPAHRFPRNRHSGIVPPRNWRCGNRFAAQLACGNRLPARNFAAEIPRQPGTAENRFSPHPIGAGESPPSAQPAPRESPPRGKIYQLVEWCSKLWNIFKKRGPRTRLPLAASFLLLLSNCQVCAGACPRK